MSKEYLEAFRDILGILSAVSGCEVDMNSEIIKTVKSSLQRLESIDNSNPSEALKELKRIDYNISYLLSECDIDEEVYMNFNSIRDNKSCEIIKQALLKSQEQERGLEILKEKNVNIGLINVLGSVEQYNQTYVYDNMRNVKWCLTEEEFELVKRYCK